MSGCMDEGDVDCDEYEYACLYGCCVCMGYVYMLVCVCVWMCLVCVFVCVCVWGGGVCVCMCVPFILLGICCLLFMLSDVTNVTYYITN